MKRILISSLFPYAYTAGTEKRTHGYALWLQQLGHDVQVVCGRDWDNDNPCWNCYSDEIYKKIPVPEFTSTGN